MNSSGIQGSLKSPFKKVKMDQSFSNFKLLFSGKYSGNNLLNFIYKDNQFEINWIKLNYIEWIFAFCMKSGNL